MAGRKALCATLDEFIVLEWLISGKPVPFEIDGVQFALRQPKPIEVDKLQFLQARAFDRAMADYRADGLADEPVTASMTETIRVYTDMQEHAYQDAQAAGDSETAIRIARDLEAAARQWPANLAQERARDYSRRVVSRLVVDTLLEGDRDAWRKLTMPDPLERSEVAAAVGKLLALINHDPNLNRRTQ